MMTKSINLYLIFAVIILLGYRSYSETYRIILKDKGNQEFKPGSELYEQTLRLHNQRCLERRSKLLLNDSIISLEDAPIFQPYIDSISNIGIEVLCKLRWRNYLIIRTEDTSKLSNKDFDFIQSIIPTKTFMSLQSAKSSFNYKDIFINDNCGAFNYFLSGAQLKPLGIDFFHKLGIIGQGVRIGLLDAGFNPNIHISTSSVNISGTYDYVDKDSIVYYTGGSDPENQNVHGTQVLALLAGFAHNQFVGVAPGAEVYLARTEDIRSEKLIEEEYYAAAVEEMESLGCDIISSSLGYSYFDNDTIGYTFELLNGKHSIASESLNAAARRGVLCITAAGNEGPNPNSISVPGDADSVITVGALIFDQNKLTKWDRSSLGNLIDGRIKPDLSAPGANIAIPDLIDYTSYRVGSGTSYATPVIAGAAALLLSVYPQLSNWELKQMLYTNASNYPKKDSLIGYGYPDLIKAVSHYRAIIAMPLIYPIRKFQRISAAYYCNEPVFNMNCFIKFNNSQDFKLFEMYQSDVGNFIADIPQELFSGDTAQLYITLNCPSDEIRMPAKENQFINIYAGKSSVPCGIELESIQEFSNQSNDCYLYPVNADRTWIMLHYEIDENTGTSISIFDINMKLLQNYIFPARQQGIVSMKIDTSELASGAYFLKIERGDSIKMLKFIITY